MSKSTYRDQSAGFIRHYLLEGDLDIEQFTVFCRGSVEIRAHQLRMTGSIIGESDILSFRMKDRTFHEILACTEVNLKNVRGIRAAYGPLDQVQPHNMSLTLWDQFHYSFCAKVLALGQAREWLASFEARVLDLQGSSGTLALVHEFESGTTDQIEDLPKTIVLAQYLDAFDEIRITTAHSYPNEQQIVRSDTTVRFL